MASERTVQAQVSVQACWDTLASLAALCDNCWCMSAIEIFTPEESPQEERGLADEEARRGAGRLASRALRQLLVHVSH